MKLKNNKGYSLIELMSVIAILIILSLAAINTFTFYYSTFAETRLKNIQKLVEFGVVKARVSKRNVTICAFTPDSFDIDGRIKKNDIKCSNSSNWGDGPLVVFYSNGGDNYFNPATDEIIATLPKGYGESIKLSLFPATNYISIKSDGFMKTSQGSIIYCDKNNNYQAALVLNIVGRVIYTDSKTKQNGDLYSC